MKSLQDQVASLKSKKQPTKKPKQQQNQTNGNQPMQNIRTSGSMAVDLFKRPARSSLMRGVTTRGIGAAGMAFLKATFAAPDFAGQGAFEGIPDDRTGLCLPTRHIFMKDLYSLITAPNEKQNTIIIQPPTPGMAFWWANVDKIAGVQANTTFLAVHYDDFGALFTPEPFTNAANVKDINSNVNEFRMAGASMELVCTSNAFNWSGSIRCFKLKLKLSENAAYTSGLNSYTKTITGLEGCNSTSTSTFIAPANLGAYMSATDSEANFRSHDIPDKINSLNVGSSSAYGVFEDWFTGFGDLETNVMVLENMFNSNGVTNFTIRCWQTLEYTPLPNTFANSLKRISPPKDEMAMHVYRQAVSMLPVAVTYADNANFFTRLLGIIGKVGGVVSNFLPGPWGIAGKALSGAATTVSNAFD